MEPENRHSCVRPGSTSRLREPVTGRQERPNSSTRSHDPITDIWKEIRHDYLEETSGCACLGARRHRASIAKLRAGVGKPDSSPALGSRADTHRAHCQQPDLWRLRLGTKLPLLWWITPLGRGLPVQAHAMA